MSWLEYPVLWPSHSPDLNQICKKDNVYATEAQDGDSLLVDVMDIRGHYRQAPLGVAECMSVS